MYMMSRLRKKNGIIEFMSERIYWRLWKSLVSLIIRRPLKLSLHVIKDLEYSDRFPCNIFKEPSNLYFRLDWLLYLYSRVLFEVLSAQGIDLTGGAASLLFKQENDAEANKSKNSAWKLNSGSVSGSKGFNFYVAHYNICNVTNNFWKCNYPMT